MDFCCGFRKGLETRALCFEEYGTIPKALKLKKISLPPLSPDEVLVEIKATSINPHDWKTVEGKLKDNLIIDFPYILGRDFAGFVKNVGSKVSKVSRGDRVFGYQPAKNNGCLGQYAVVNQKYVCPLEETINFEDAAAIPFSAGLAYHVLHEILKVKYNTKIWITNGSGGVGSWAVQIAKEAGAIVIATTSTENKSWLRKLGADEVVDYRLTKPDQFPKNVDLIFDTWGNLKELNPMKFMKAGGKIVSIVEEIDPALAQMYQITSSYYDMNASCDNLAEIMKMIKNGRIKQQIRSKFTFLDLTKALDSSKMGHVDGKIVISIDEKDIIKAFEMKEKFFEIEKSTESKPQFSIDSTDKKKDDEIFDDSKTKLKEGKNLNLKKLIFLIA